MLFPKKVKYRKWHTMRKNPIKVGSATRGITVAFGSYGLKALDQARIKSNQIEAARKVLSRSVGKTGRLWIRMAVCRNSREQFLFYLSFDFVKELWIVFQEIANCITALSQLFIVVRQPGSRFLKNLMLDGQINDACGTGNSFIKHNVKFGSFKRSRTFVLYDFNFYTIPNHFFTFSLESAASLASSSDIPAFRETVSLTRPFICTTRFMVSSEYSKARGKL